jgi:hypothetical protein
MPHISEAVCGGNVGEKEIPQKRRRRAEEKSDLKVGNSNDDNTTNPRSENEIESIDEGVAGGSAMSCCKRQHHSFERRESERVVSNLLLCISLSTHVVRSQAWKYSRNSK